VTLAGCPRVLPSATGFALAQQAHSSPPTESSVLSSTSSPNRVADWPFSFRGTHRVRAFHDAVTVRYRRILHRAKADSRRFDRTPSWVALESGSLPPGTATLISIMHRRSFLKSTVALAVATPFARSLTTADAAATLNPRVKIGFLAWPTPTRWRRVKVIRESPLLNSWGSAKNPEKVREPYVNLDVRFLRRKHMFKECAVVAVESAVRDHARHARLALEAGKHVHVEKPPAILSPPSSTRDPCPG
jgi:hypothetical protein